MTIINDLARHINAEQYAAHAYRALANWADANAFPGLAAWADAASAEEQTHAMAFIAFARTRSYGQTGPVALYPLAAPPDVSSYGDALAAALTIELSVAESLDALCKAGDEATAQLAGDYLLKEQWPAIHAIEQYLLRVRRGAPLDLLDAELFEEAA